MFNDFDRYGLGYFDVLGHGDALHYTVTSVERNSFVSTFVSTSERGIVGA